MTATAEVESFGRVTSPKGACERLNCSIPTFYELVDAGELETFKLGKFRKVTERSIDALIARQIAAEKANRSDGGRRRRFGRKLEARDTA